MPASLALGFLMKTSFPGPRPVLTPSFHNCLSFNASFISSSAILPDFFLEPSVPPLLLSKLFRGLPGFFLGIFVPSLAVGNATDSASSDAESS